LTYRQFSPPLIAARSFGGYSVSRNTNVFNSYLIIPKEKKMNIIIYLIVAAIIGWIATEIMHDRGGLLINIIVAVIGAFLAGWFLSPIFHVGTINQAITVPTMLLTLAGAVVLLLIVNLITHRGRR